MSKSQKLPILVVGATGQLGGLIARHSLRKPNLLVNILIRNPDKDKDLCSEVQKAGGKVFKADVSNPASIKGTTEGIHTVVSALIGDDLTVLDGQKNLLKDSVANKVHRFVPSDFALDYRKLKLGEHIFLDQRIKFRKILAESPVKGLHVFNGVFLETFFFLQNNNYGYLINPYQPLNMTTYEDTARFTAAAVAKPERIGDLFISGDVITPKQIADTYNRVRGAHISPRKNLSFEELHTLINDFKEEKEYTKAALMSYNIPFSDGRGFFAHLENWEFPEIHPMTFEDYLKAHPEAHLSFV